ncbi:MULTISPECIES: NAD(P)H-dependent oxidoreductase [unclassified Streptomyces]|uniref:FMN-dependent NADH-azoreductase n=1 Tax=unclassified Streptomyces TaxID=2593676 RepID=UPI002DDB1D19|nr:MULTISPECIES: NAD(P)H-dependent oxidoreductase [unclassified Streptomyces]WSA93594.1 NAD(P)H-dependent oxidoreductase [Streptomyces sp. NBC_01795]WSB77965.1 NAD(P)H-dependent oxidoreductase [Streptomyces sp. NBC_01775]WSS13780.1 NAD(P)H-dependent oxidoreductase [Streptomyces sp. NBC_01186]WSS42604.1 NAD(P)H-dependent oxidoreductase [Streptomyces sp. NBC_01187]
MATLLHIDSSLFPQEASVSRDVTASFRKAWEAEHPDGTVIYRDLGANPLPHLDGLAASAGFTAPDDRSPEQAAAFVLRDELAGELERADAVLIGAPMYNFTIPSTLKAWLDQVIIIGRTTGTDAPSAAGKPATVVASRGGGYGPGTPRESFEFVQNYLGKVLGEGGFGLDVEFIVPELTLAETTPGMEELIDLAKTSRAQAHEAAESRAKALAANLAA